MAREKEACTGGILNIQADMTGIPMRKEDLVGVHGKNGEPKKRQVKGGIVFRQEANKDGEMQRIPSSTTRVVSFDDVSLFSQTLLNEAVKRGYHEALTVVFTADGAEWIWIMVEDRFKGAVQIVDFYHAAEHLGELCRLAEPDKQKADALFTIRRRLMRSYGAACVIRYFENLPSDHPKKTEIEGALGYFRKTSSPWIMARSANVAIVSALAQWKEPANRSSISAQTSPGNDGILLDPSTSCASAG